MSYPEPIRPTSVEEEMMTIEEEFCLYFGVFLMTIWVCALGWI